MRVCAAPRRPVETTTFLFSEGETVRAKALELQYKNAQAVKRYKEREIQLMISELIWRPDLHGTGGC